MTQFRRLLAAGAALGTAIAMPLAAQQTPPAPAPAAPAAAPAPVGDEKVNMVIIYGDDACPKSTGDEITVCARKAEGERYRIPAPLRGIDAKPADSWSERVLAYESVGATGTNSCSAVGDGGWTGCTQKLIHDAYVERKNSPDVQFSKLIEAARAKRLSTIDADAARQQADVEAAEKEYEARQHAAQDPESGDKAASPAAPAASPAPAPATTPQPAMPAGTALPPPDDAAGTGK